MAERPILFSAPMVRALLNGTKTQTRRVVKPQPEHGVERCHYSRTGWARAHERGGGACTCRPIRAPYGVPGDLLWVRESGELLSEAFDHDPATGRDLWRDAGWRYADGSIRQTIDYDPPLAEWADDCAARRRPSIHMPRWASRITLRITDVRVERLQEISEADAIAEGVERITSDSPFWKSYVEDFPALDPVTSYAGLWDSINGKRPGCAWADNPWVWCLSLTVRHG